MNVRFSKPAPVLGPYIERYWGWDFEGKEELHMPTIPPGVGMDMFFHCRAPFATLQQGHFPKSHLLFSLQQPTALLPSSNIGFIAVRFRAGMFKHFCAIPLAELPDLYPDAIELWGRNGSQLLERVNNAEGFESRVAWLDQYFSAMLSVHKKQASPWSCIARDIYYHHDPARLEALAKQTHLSYRQFRRRFIDETGIAPKHFQQLVRFRSTLRPLLINKERQYLGTALDNGYFDQMHFIKEFKRFLGATPSNFLQEKNFMSHFYYPSL